MGWVGQLQGSCDQKNRTYRTAFYLALGSADVRHADPWRIKQLLFGEQEEERRPTGDISTCCCLERAKSHSHPQPAHCSS